MAVGAKAAAASRGRLGGFTTEYTEVTPRDPKNGRFLKGQTGNPLGRPRKNPLAAPPDWAYPKTKEELNDWFEASTGYRLPAKAVCAGRPGHRPHVAPLEVAWAVFANKVDEAVVLASRGGGKTLLFALIHWANSYWKEGFQTCHFAGIESQALKCQQYLRKISRVKASEHGIDIVLKAEAHLTNGSSIEMKALTVNQANSPHPSLTSLDEVDTCRVPSLIEDVRATPMSYGEHPGQFIAGSTRRSAKGPMDAALESAEARRVPIYEWCYRETIQRGEQLSESSPLAGVVTQEQLDRADGWRTLRDVETARQRQDDDTWAAQYENARPEAKALVYPIDIEANITPDAAYRHGAGPVYLGYDWGYTEPTAVVFVQLRNGAFYQFAELVAKGKSERTWTRDLVRLITELPGYDGPSLDEWEGIWKTNNWRNIRWPACWPSAAGDPSAVQFRSELKQHGIAAASSNRVKHSVVAGQAVLRSALSTAAGERRYYIHPDCKHTIAGIQNLRTKEMPDGSYSATPDPDPRNHRFSHAPDAVRYLVWRHRRFIGFASGSDDDASGESE